MKWKVLLLNYDSEFVEYCNAPSLSLAIEANADLRRRGFQENETKLVKIDE